MEEKDTAESLLSGRGVVNKMRDLRRDRDNLSEELQVLQSVNIASPDY